MSDEGAVPSEFWRFARELDAICDRFEHAWQSGEVPSIANTLEGVPIDQQRELLGELVAIDLEYRWRSSGRHRPLELSEYLEQWPALGGPGTVALDLIELEYRLKIECQHPCDIEAYLATFGSRDGQLADALVRVARQASADEARLRRDELQPGLRIGSFQLLERLGTGSFGTVWKALDEQLDREVAIKFPLGDRTTEDEQERFLKEARAAARPQHPGIVRVHAFGRERGIIYIVKDWIDGPNLAEWLSKRRPSPRESATLCIQIAEALEHAHNLGIVHRDMKPANVLIHVNDGGVVEPRVTDFGLALRESDSNLGEGRKRLGSPAYMSPEQARGDSDVVDRRADVYSLGVVLFEMVTGERPFRGSASALLDAVIHEPPPDPVTLNRQLDLDLSTICLKCLEKSPARRYATARELAADLQRWVEGRPIHARPLGPTERALRWISRNAVLSSLTLGLFAVLSLGLAGVAWQWSRADANAVRAERGAEEMRRNLYVSEMNLVQRIWEQGNVQAGLNKLDQLRPKSDQSDLRSFAWYHWRHRFQIEHRSISVDEKLEGLDVSPNNQWVAGAGSTGKVVLVDIPSGKVQRRLDGHRQVIRAVRFLSDDRLLTGCYEGQLRLWDVNDGSCLKFATLPTRVYAIDVTKDGLVALIATGHGLLRVRAEDLAIMPAWELGDKPVTAVRVSPDGRQVAVGTMSGEIVVVDAQHGEVLQTFHSEDEIRCLDWAPDGSMLAACSYASEVTVWTTDSGEQVSRITTPWLRFLAIRFSRDGSLLYVAGNDTFVQGFDPLTGNPISRLIGHADGITGLEVLKDNSIVSGCRDRTLKHWSVEGDTSVAYPDLHSDSVKSVTFAPDGVRLASTGYDGLLQVYDVRNDQIVRTLPTGSAKNLSVVFSPCGEYLAVAQSDRGRVQVWNAVTGTLLHDLDTGVEQTFAVSFTRSGHLVAGCSYGKIAVWDWKEGARIQLLDHHDGVQVFAIDASVKDDLFASGGWNGKVVVWSTQTWKPVKMFDCVDQLVNGVRFSPDGRLLAAATSQNIELWDTRTYSQVARLSGHQQAVNAPAFTPDGVTLASGSWDGTVKLWDLRTFSEKATFSSYSNGVAFSADGRYLASAGATPPFVSIWSAPPGDD